MSTALRVLIVEDSEDDATLLALELRRGGFELTHERVDRAADMREALSRQTWDVVISGFSMPHFGAFEALEIAKAHDPDLPFIIVSGTIGEDVAVEAMRVGASDYVMKGNLARLIPAIQRELRDAEQRRTGRAAQAALVESEQRYALVEEAVDDGLWDWNILTGEDFVSPRWKGILGFAEDELENVDSIFFERLHPDDKARVTEAHRAHIEDDQNYLCVFRLKHRDGTYRWILSRGRAIRDDAGQAVRMVGSITDITERKLSEEKLREGTELLQATHKANPDLQFIIASDGAIMSYHANDESKLYLPPEDFLGKKMEEILPEKVGDQIKAAINKATSTGSLVTIEYELPMPDCARSFDARIVPLPDQRLVVTVRDITERKLSEEKLIKSEAMLNEAQRIAHIGSWELDLIKNELTWSDEIYRIFELEPQQFDATYEAFLEYVHPDDRESLNKIYSESVASKQPYDIVHRIVTSSGATRYVHERCITQYDDNDRAVRSIGTVEDITARKLAEEEKAALEVQLNQAQKMESIGRLAGGVAHDLNNLLTPILCFSELLEQDLNRDAESTEFAKQIHRAGIGARDLVRQLLAFSRKQTLEVQSVDLSSTVRDFESLLRHTIKEDISITTSLEYDISPVSADVRQIEQVIMNLVVNAADAVTVSGEIQIDTANVTLDEEFVQAHEGATAGEFVMLTVTDNGSGMDDEILKQVFEPFYSTKGERGTGLGLSTVYGIVKQHGGYVAVDSTVGKGTTISVYMPVFVGQHPEAKTTSRVRHDSSRSETVIVVEDYAPLRDLIKMILVKHGYTVIVASNGVDALSKMETLQKPADLLLTDVVMPKMGGSELFAKARKKWPAVKVLYMSGYSQDEISKHGVLYEGIDFIQKPFTLEGIATKVNVVLDKE